MAIKLRNVALMTRNVQWMVNSEKIIIFMNGNHDTNNDFQLLNTVL